ncbi:MAG: TlpA disulfide reductase family protein [Rhodoferax sp.]|nr:TlpA disulfide reductase family protein [Rhodoferax sp.]
MKRRHALACLAGGLAAFSAAVATEAHAGLGYDVQAWPTKQPVPSGSMTDLQGTEWRLPALRGRAVLLNFWASWCEPCKEEMPSLQALADRHPDRLVVLTINLKESPEAIARFVLASGLRLPVVRDADGSLARAWGVRIYPSTVLIDAKRRVRSVARGGLDWAGDEGAALVQPLLPR